MQTQNYYELKVKVNGVDLLYIYDNGIVTYPSRGSIIDVTIPEFINTIKLIEDWIKSIEIMPEVAPSYGLPDEPFRYRMVKDNDDILFRWRIGGNLSLVMTFNTITKLINAEPRNEFTTTWAGFVYTVIVINRNMIDMINRACI